MKKAIIIGATSGMGRELAYILADEGYLVGITGRRGEILDQMQADMPDKFISKQFDLASSDNIAMLNELSTQLGGLDLIIISAGISGQNDNLDFELEKKIISVNVLGFTQVFDWAFNYFKQQNSGHIAAISSIAGLRGGRLSPAYNASKSYQINYMEGLTQKARKSDLDIYITDIRPGFIDTRMANKTAKFWVTPVNEAARKIYHAIKIKREVTYITNNWLLIALILKVFPRGLYERI